jgi:Flp pilus assembly pilin Flp
MTDAFTWLVVRAQNVVANAREREEGQTFVEYALLLAGILKDRIAKLFSDTGSSISAPS